MLLRVMDVTFREIDVMVKSSHPCEMSVGADSNSVPQIFVDGRQISECTRIYALEAEGELVAKLGLDG